MISEILFGVAFRYTKSEAFIIILCIALLAAGIVSTVSAMMFGVNVEGSMIKVRNRRGQRYEFSCSEIEKVICSQENSTKYGPSFSLTVVTASHELDLAHTMAGFQNMAGYLLEKHESGEIRQKAVSENCKTRLRQYKNGDFYRKKKK